MFTAKVTSKGQITIPKNIRENLGLRPGENINFEEKDGVYYLKKAVPTSSFNKWKGRLKMLKDKGSDIVVKEVRGE